MYESNTALAIYHQAKQNKKENKEENHEEHHEEQYLFSTSIL